MTHTTTGRRIAAGLVTAALATGIVSLTTAGAAQADTGTISFTGSVAEVPRGDDVADALDVSIDEATAAAHPNASMRVRLEDSVEGWQEAIVFSDSPRYCRGGAEDVSCELNPRGWGTQTRWSFGLRSLDYIPAEATMFIAELVDDHEVLASARYTVAVRETEVQLRTWTETVTVAPGQTADFAPRFANAAHFTTAGAGVVIDIVGDDKVMPVAAYDNCVSSGALLTCVVPEVAVPVGETIAVSAQTPLSLRLDEAGPYDDVCSNCHQVVRAVGVAEARQLLERLGGTETGDVLELVPAEPHDRELDPVHDPDPNLLVQIGS